MDPFTHAISGAVANRALGPVQPAQLDRRDIPQQALHFIPRRGPNVEALLAIIL
jgi:hypothetical protein